MNKNPVDHGISLQLADYHNEWVRYDLTSIEFVDSEGESQMSEWRIIATVLANVRDIRESVDYLMEQIENKIVAATDELPNPPATPPVLII